MFALKVYSVFILSLICGIMLLISVTAFDEQERKEALLAFFVHTPALMYIILN